MPKFFNLEDLTEYQLKNFDKYKSQYNFVLEKNLEKTINKMTKLDKEKYMKLFSIKKFSEEEFIEKLRSSTFLMANNPGDNKSALFNRLLNEKPVYVNPPPCSYSYPDYSFLENETELEISFFEEKDIVHKSDKFFPFKHIIINQSPWKITKEIDQYTYLITHLNWEKEGFVWELKMVEKSAKETNSYTLSHFNPNIPRITKYSEMIKEVDYQVKNLNYILDIAKDESKYNKYEKEMVEKYQSFGKGIALNAKTSGLELIKKRLEKGLPDYMTEEEIKKQNEEYLKNYMANFIIRGDDLYAKTWILKRIDGKDINNYILKIEN